MDQTQNSESSDMPNPLAWKFLQEPLWRWFVFIVAMGLILHSWRSVLNEIK